MKKIFRSRNPEIAQNPAGKMFVGSDSYQAGQAFLIFNFVLRLFYKYP